MGLKCNIINDFNVEASYWNIGKMIIDSDTNTINVFIDGYENKEARDNNEKPVSIIPIIVDYDPFKKFIGERFKIDADAFKKYCYEEFIKKLDKFKDAEDVVESIEDNDIDKGFTIPEGLEED